LERIREAQAKRAAASTTTKPTVGLASV
jgi:hypothetical protein